MPRKQPRSVVKQASSASTTQTIASQHWSGPLPHPADLDQFDRLIPNGAERIFVMVEQEQAHRIKHGNTVLNATIADTRRGHWLGGTISVIAIAGSVLAVYIGAHPTVSVALVGLPLATVIRSMIQGRSK